MNIDDFPTDSQVYQADDLLGLAVIRRAALRRLVPFSDSHLRVLERAGEFPRRFLIGRRCVAWHLREVLAWIESRRAAAGKSLGPKPKGVGKRQRPANSRS